ncbi:MAG: sigma-70 family RNA polymerase sigma factor [Flavobacteriales bacterium]|nr:sigma-70 family RNA polymerase sigma factor [Flavobacteriales bacterium]
MGSIEFNSLLVVNRDFLKGFALGFTRDMQDAEDLIQDTMVKALRYKNNFKEGTNIKGWLYTIMRNIFINNYKRKKFQNTIVDTTENQFFINSSTQMQADTVTTVINEQDIRDSIDSLKDEFRVPFNMFVEGFHYDEIAEELAIPMGTVKSRIFHARKKLGTQLSEFRN